MILRPALHQPPRKTVHGAQDELIPVARSRDINSALGPKRAKERASKRRAIATSLDDNEELQTLTTNWPSQTTPLYFQLPCNKLYITRHSEPAKFIICRSTHALLLTCSDQRYEPQQSRSCTYLEMRRRVQRSMKKFFSFSANVSDHR